MTALINTIRNLKTMPFRLKAFDRVILTLLLGLLVLVLFDPAQFFKSLWFMADSIGWLAPFFALAILFAGYAEASGITAPIARVASGNQIIAIISASFLGALSPFCSCGVIPVIAAVLSAGVPLAPVMAFWIASPVMDPEMFILTAAGIGMNFAIAKTIAALAMGLMAGFITHGLQAAGYMGNPIKKINTCGCGSSAGSKSSAGIVWNFWKEAARREAFLNEIKAIGWFLGKWLILAFFLESLMVAYIPSHWIASVVGADNPFAIPLTTIIGLPSYLNGYASIPLTSGLLEMGMSPGAAMAFMTSGAVSSIPAAIAVYALVRKPVFGVYIVLGLAGSMLAGYAYHLSGAAI